MHTPPTPHVCGQTAAGFATVAFGHQPRVADHQHTSVGFRADQSPCTLFEVDDRLRDLIRHKAIFTAFFDHAQTRCEHRIVRRCERQFVDNDQGQRLATHIHTFPETLRANQYRIFRRAVLIEQFGA